MLEKLDAAQEMPEEIFTAVFDIRDGIERQRLIESLRRTAGAAKPKSRLREFNDFLKKYREDYIQKMKQADHKTEFTDAPIVLYCGEWEARDIGIRTVRYTKNGDAVPETACSHPILPTEILKNVDTSEERITLAYLKNGEWQHLTVNRSVCADSSKIVSALSRYGIEVTSENAKSMVRYISDCVGFNPAALKPKDSIGRLGWLGESFVPYKADIRYEGEQEFRPIFENIRENGDFGTWKELCRKLRQNEPMRILLDASFASVLIEKLRILPFACHIWGPSGTGKTVALMAAMSIWGNPKLGGLVKSMNMTKNALMQYAAFLCNIPFAGDELQTIKDKWGGNYDQLIYQMTEGVDRGRAKMAGGVEETRTWRNSFLTTGEEPITKADSASGSRNRVIEIAIDEPIIADGHYVSGAVQDNYGHAGRIFVEHIRKMNPECLRERYRAYLDSLTKLDTTDKQAMAMACILTADELARELFWPEEEPIREPGAYLHKVSEVDVPGRAREAVKNWAAVNTVRFAKPGEDSVNRGEVWGKLEGDVLTVNRDVLRSFLQKNNFDFSAVMRQWAKRGDIIRNSQGKYVHNTKVYDIKAMYVKVFLPGDDSDENGENAEDGGFVEVGEQMELPFD